MLTIILLYILVCHKTSLGVEWYDWALLGTVWVIGFLHEVVRQIEGAGREVPSIIKKKGSFFSDLLPGEDKNE
jgi:hypothetical protein